MENDKTFLDLQVDRMKVFGFWEEKAEESVVYAIESLYNREILKDYCIIKVLPNDNSFIVKWDKRLLPLTLEEVKKKYGK